MPMPPHTYHFVGSAEAEFTPFAKSKKARMTASAPTNMSHKNMKLLKRGKRSNACLRRYHVVTTFD